MKSIVYIFILFFLLSPDLYSQQYDLPDNIIEFIENNAEDADIGALETLYDNLIYYQNNPMDINKVGFQDLVQLRLLTDLQINNILVYRDLVGDFIRLEELQAVPGMDLASIRRILPFITLESPGADADLWDRIFNHSSRALYVRYERDFPKPDGYLGEKPSFEGSPDQLYMRLRWRAGTDFSAGFTLEKDPGEAFFHGSNRLGFDYYSAHVWLRRDDKFIRTIALGDYNVSLGQGLIRNSAYGGGKSSFVMDINKRGKKLSKYSSVGENNYLRGVATELAFSDKLSLLLAASYRKRDANQILEVDTLESRQERFISSLQSSGLHRTDSEIADEDAVSNFSTGGALTYNTRKFEVSVNAWYDQLGDSLGTTPRPSNLYRFSGNKLFNASIDYQYRASNFLLFGESAISDNGGHAHIIGFLTALHPKLDMGLSLRYLSRDYQVLAPNAFAENSRAQNERGVYFSLIYRFSPKWTLSVYQDIWSHQWLRYQVDAPSEGNEQFIRIRYYVDDHLTAYLQFKNKTRNVNTADRENRSIVQAETRRSLRLHLSYPINKAWEWRTRIQVSQFLVDHQSVSRGYLLYTDILYRPISFPISFTSRLAYFQTEDYNSRIYAYENNLLYTFSIPAYYSTGIRTYINVRWKVFYNLTLEARYALTFLPYDKSISSSYNEVKGNKRHEFKAQMKLKF